MVKLNSDRPIPPKRPMTAFFIYKENVFEETRHENPEARDSSELTKIIAEKWRGLSENEKTKYIKKNQELKAIYEKELAIYEDKYGKVEKKKRKEKKEKKENKEKKISKSKAAKGRKAKEEEEDEEEDQEDEEDQEGDEEEDEEEEEEEEEKEEQILKRPRLQRKPNSSFNGENLKSVAEAIKNMAKAIQNMAETLENLAEAK